MATARDLPTGPQRPRAPSRWRRGGERLVLLAVAALVLRTWYVEGLFVPFKVTGGSMAGTLVGLHRELACADCGYRFACGTDSPPIRPRAVCPNCGYGENDLAGQPDLDGDRLLVDKLTFRLRPPRRWEPIAFRDPGEPSRLVAKRVVGLPGESIQIRDGDIYADGKLVRKTLPEQRALAVLVYDADFPPRLTTGLRPRWDDDRVGQPWGAANGHFACDATPGAASVDWLTYHHWVRVPGHPGDARESPITNFLAYNQTRAGRAENVRPVAELMLSFRLVRCFGEGELLVRATDGRDEFLVRIEPGRLQYEVEWDGRPIGLGPGRLPAWTDELHVEVSLFDQQLLVAFDGRPTFVYPYERDSDERRPVDTASSPTSQPLAVGSRALGTELREVRVYRDVYYTRPIGGASHWGFDEPARLGASDYFVLGDNSSISEDSRTWPEPGVPAGLIVGRPLLVHFPARQIGLGPWHFQVPDVGKIRYIR